MGWKSAYKPRQPISVDLGGVLYHGTYVYEHGMVKVNSEYGSGVKIIQASPGLAEIWAKHGLREMVREHKETGTPRDLSTRRKVISISSHRRAQFSDACRPGPAGENAKQTSDVLTKKDRPFVPMQRNGNDHHSPVTFGLNAPEARGLRPFAGNIEIVSILPGMKMYLADSRVKPGFRAVVDSGTVPPELKYETRNIYFSDQPNWTWASRYEALETIRAIQPHIAGHKCNLKLEELSDGRFAVFCDDHPASKRPYTG